MVPFYPFCRKCTKWTNRFMLFLVQKTYMLLKKIHHRLKSKRKELCLQGLLHT